MLKRNWRKRYYTSGQIKKWIPLFQNIKGVPSVAPIEPPFKDDVTFDFYARDTGSYTIQESIAGNDASVVGGSVAYNDGTDYAVGDHSLFTDSQSLEITISADTGISNYSGALGFEIDSDNFINIRRPTSDKIELQSKVSGASILTELTTLTTGVFYKIKLIDTGTQAEIYLNDTYIGLSGNDTFSVIRSASEMFIGVLSVGSGSPSTYEWKGWLSGIFSNDILIYGLNGHLYDSINNSKATNSGLTFDIVNDTALNVVKYALDNGYYELSTGEQIIGEPGDGWMDIFNTEFINSVTYSTGIRSAQSEYSFNYSGTELRIKTNPTIASYNAARAVIVVLIDDEYFATITTPDTSYYSLTLPSGDKKVSLIESLLTKPTATILGCFITNVEVQLNSMLKISESNVSEKLVFIGDSITVGGNSDTPAVESFPRLFKIQNSKEVGVLGWGFGKLEDFAVDSGTITTTLSYFTSMFSNVTTTKKLIIALGTNDYGLSSTPSSTFSGWYSDLLDAINTSDSDIEVYCISPLLRTGETSLLEDYRTAISGLCDTRAYTTYIDGSDILELTDLDDGVHPTVAGHLKYKQYLETIIL